MNLPISQVMKDPLEALQHTRWRRAYLIFLFILGFIVFQVTVLPRACRIALAHIALRNTRTRNVHYSQAPRNTLDVYRVKDAAGLCPVIIFCHGGAWNSYVSFSFPLILFPLLLLRLLFLTPLCSPFLLISFRGDKLHYCTLAQTLQKHGIVVVVINYTLYPKVATTSPFPPFPPLRFAHIPFSLSSNFHSFEIPALQLLPVLHSDEHNHTREEKNVSSYTHI